MILLKKEINLSVIKKEIYSVTNGEIYNDKELINKENLVLNLLMIVHVIPDLYLEERVLSRLSELNGMFASAIIDYKNKIIIICRDLEGIKPLYYIEDKIFYLFLLLINIWLIYSMKIN